MRKYKIWVFLGVVIVLSLLVTACAPASMPESPAQASESSIAQPTIGVDGSNVGDANGDESPKHILDKIRQGMNVIDVRLLFGVLGIVIIILIMKRRKKDKDKDIDKVCFGNAEILGLYNKESRELARAKITYNIISQHKSIRKVRAELQVLKDGAPFEDITLADLTPLKKGQVSLSNEYVPEGGWQKGSAYNFMLALYVADKLCTTTKPQLKTVRRS